MANWSGQLKFNDIFLTITNQVIRQKVFDLQVYDTKKDLAEMSKIEGGMLGDCILFYAMHEGKTFEWLNDAEAANLLKLHRPKDPECQAITIDQFRMIPLTVDQYMTKRAFMDMNVFGMFNSVILSAIQKTKDIYESTFFNAFVGTHKAGLEANGKGAAQNLQIKIPAKPTNATEANLEAYNRLVAETIAEAMANLIVDLSDITQNYNDYGIRSSFNPDELVYAWNSDWVNKIRKFGEPMLFNKDGLIDKFAQHTLPARYFGNVNASSGTTGATNTTIRSLIEKDYNTVEPHDAGYETSLHIFPGDLLPANTAYGANETYTEDPNIPFKVFHKESIPFAQATQLSSEFYNPRSATSTHYLIWGYASLTHLKNLPFVTAEVVVAE